MRCRRPQRPESQIRFIDPRAIDYHKTACQDARLRLFVQRYLVQTAKDRLPQSIDGPLTQHLSTDEGIRHPIVDMGEILLPKGRGQIVLGIGQIVRVGEAVRESRHF
jgi:allophanate hydrolase subunit 2